MLRADSWEEAADAAATPSPSHSADTSSIPHTPDDDEDDVDDDSEREEKKKKKTIIIASDEGPLKEPVNVIFIGHVGEQLIAFFLGRFSIVIMCYNL